MGEGRAFPVLHVVSCALRLTVNYCSIARSPYDSSALFFFYNISFKRLCELCRGKNMNYSLRLGTWAIMVRHGAKTSHLQVDSKNRRSDSGSVVYGRSLARRSRPALS